MTAPIYNSYTMTQDSYEKRIVLEFRAVSDTAALLQCMAEAEAHGLDFWELERDGTAIAFVDNR